MDGHQPAAARPAPAAPAAALDGPALYEADEHLWVARQVEALRSGRLHELDRETLAQHLDDMTRRDHRELRSRLVTLLMHILKVRHQPERLSRSWVSTILRERREIAEFLRGIPSLRSGLAETYAEAWRIAVADAAKETGLPRSALPAQPTFGVDEALAFEPPDPPESPPARAPRKVRRSR